MIVYQIITCRRAYEKRPLSLERLQSLFDRFLSDVHGNRVKSVCTSVLFLNEVDAYSYCRSHNTSGRSLLDFVGKENFVFEFHYVKSVIVNDFAI